MPKPTSEHRFSIQDVTNIAIKKVNIPGWQSTTWEAADGGSIVVGCVPAGVFTKGPRKGQPRFNHPEVTDRRRVIVSDSEMATEAVRYEAETGLCWDCKGSGQSWAGWSAATGVRHATCSRCDATGKRQFDPPPATQLCAA